MARELKKQTGAGAKPKLPMIVEKSAGAVVFHRNGERQYLLLRANHWEFPKGLVDARESEEDAAVREVRQETGLEIALVPGFKEKVQYFYRRKDGGALVKKQVVYFLGEARTREHKISWEHQEARWVNLEQSLELLEYENLRTILRRAHVYAAS